MRKQDLVPREAILDVLRSASPRALHTSRIGDDLGVPRTQRRGLSELLDDLVFEGHVDALPGSRYRLSGRAPQHELAVGEFRAHPRGFGFVVRDDGGPDVFIDGPAIAGAMHLDGVEVEVRPTPRGPAGSVVRVIRRGLPRVPGVLRYAPHGSWLEPDDARVRTPIQVSDAGFGPAQDGKAVVVEITEFPNRADETARGRVMLVLGEPGDPRVELDKILFREGIATDFSPQALEHATLVARAPGSDAALGRTDLRNVPLLTIDPIDARDHDDAVQIEEHPSGHCVRIAIADVSHYVRPSTPLDDDARDRGTSIYLPARVVPMLPLALSADVCSLVAGEDRLALVVEAVLDVEGEVLESRFLEAVVRPAASLHYDGVARALGLSKTAQEQREASAHGKQLRTLLAVTRVLKRRRAQRGSIDFNLPEAQVMLDPETGAVRGIRRRAQDPGVKVAYSIVEELMLLANELVARELGARGLPTIYRVHAPPDEAKLEVFCQLAHSFGYALSVEDGQSPGKLAEFLRKLEGKPVERALTSLLLRAMKQAQYDVTNIGHFGLASREYLHFTSPIRRYPDLVVHRTLRAALSRGPGARVTPEEVEALTADAVRSSKRERRAMDVEREVVDLYRALYMLERVGECFWSTVTGLAPHGMYCELDEPFAEGLLLLESLEDDEFEYHEEQMRIVGRNSGRSFALGDRLEVQVSDVSVVRRTTYLKFVASDPAASLAPEKVPARDKRRQRSARKEAVRKHHAEAAPKRSRRMPKQRKR